MDGQRREAAVRQTLERCGVRGSNLNILAAAERLTPEAVAEEYAAIRKDGNVRSPAAVLVQRLAGMYGLTLPARRRPLDAALRAQNEQLRRLRQDRRSG